MSTTKVITISREYGAGGRTIARQLSEKLNIPWYDKDLVAKVAADSGYSVDDINKDGEEYGKMNKILDSILNSAVSYTSTHDGIYQAQKEAILKVAKEPCIIVGRCANVILQEAGIDSFDVFLYADLDHRMARAGQLDEAEGTDLKKYVEERDQKRALYYQKYTQKQLGDYHDYDLLLNTGLLGTDTAIQIILNALS